MILQVIRGPGFDHPDVLFGVSVDSKPPKSGDHNPVRRRRRLSKSLAGHHVVTAESTHAFRRYGCTCGSATSSVG